MSNNTEEGNAIEELLSNKEDEESSESEVDDHSDNYPIGKKSENALLKERNEQSGQNLRAQALVKEKYQILRKIIPISTPKR